MAKRVLTDEDWYVLSLCFDYRYYYSMRKDLEESDACYFCNPNPQRNPILFENEHWWISANAYPNERKCQLMLIILSKEHWRHLGEIVPAAWASYAEVINWIEKKYVLPGGMLFLRFGDMRFNAGSQRHLHWNLWVPDTSGEVIAPIHKSVDMIAEDTARAEKFNQMYLAGVVPEAA